MEINNLNKESYINNWIDEIKNNHKNLNFGQLFMAHKKDFPSISVIHETIIRVEGNLQDNQFLRCSTLFAKQFPEFFDINLESFKFPDSPEEKWKVLEILLRSETPIEKLKLDEYSLEEILKILPTHPAQPYLLVLKFKSLGLIKHLENADSKQSLFCMIEKILNRGSWAAEGLAKNIKTLLKTYPLTLEEELDLCQNILRLLWDNKNQRAVLLQEPTYQKQQIDQIKVAIDKGINEYAIKITQFLKIPLVSFWWDTKKEMYDGTVNFLGGPSPFLYTDSGEGVVENGHLPFKIDNCRLLFNP